MKACNLCKKELALDQFHKNKRNQDGLNNRCKKCTVKYNRDRYRNNASVRLKVSNYGKANRLKLRLNRYGIDESVYNSLIEKQNGVCAICKKAAYLYIDHDHASGIVRGMLCLQCNTALGNFNDDKRLLQEAIKYLRN